MGNSTDAPATDSDLEGSSELLLRKEENLKRLKNNMVSVWTNQRSKNIREIYEQWNDELTNKKEFR